MFGPEASPDRCGRIQINGSAPSAGALVSVVTTVGHINAVIFEVNYFRAIPTK